MTVQLERRERSGEKKRGSDKPKLPNSARESKTLDKVAMCTQVNVFLRLPSMPDKKLPNSLPYHQQRLRDQDQTPTMLKTSYGEVWNNKGKKKEEKEKKREKNCRHPRNATADNRVWQPNIYIYMYIYLSILLCGFLVALLLLFAALLRLRARHPAKKRSPAGRLLALPFFLDVDDIHAHRD